MGERLWNVQRNDSASPSPEESSPNRYGFDSEDLLSLSNYSSRDIVDSDSRGETQHGGSAGGP